MIIGYEIVIEPDGSFSAFRVESWAGTQSVAQPQRTPVSQRCGTVDDALVACARDMGGPLVLQLTSPLSLLRHEAPQRIFKPLQVTTKADKP